MATLLMESIALYYQYQLDYGPCVLCVQIRAWILLIMIASVAGIATANCRIGQTTALAATTIASVGMLERSWVTLGVERGFIESSCSMAEPFPSLIRFDQWLPVIFEPWEPCGYTPELLFGITMAEALIVAAVALLLCSLVAAYFLVIRVKVTH